MLLIPCSKNISPYASSSSQSQTQTTPIFPLVKVGGKIEVENQRKLALQPSVNKPHILHLFARPPGIHFIDLKQWDTLGFWPHVLLVSEDVENKELWASVIAFRRANDMARVITAGDIGRVKFRAENKCRIVSSLWVFVPFFFSFLFSFFFSFCLSSMWYN